MTFEVGDAVQFERDGVMVIGTVTSVKGREPCRVMEYGSGRFGELPNP